VGEDARQDWETPHILFTRLREEFDLRVDACANPANKKLKKFWDVDKNGLQQDWRGKNVWCNPPYKGIGPWIQRGQGAASRAGGTRSVFLLPARCEQPWFHVSLFHASEISFFTGRIQFKSPPGIKSSSNRESSVLVVFDSDAKDNRVLTRRDARTGKVLSTWSRSK
jgi:phage N-6-adenine-methyltransferase